MARTAVVAGVGDDEFKLRVCELMRLTLSKITASAAFANVVREALWEQPIGAQPLCTHANAVCKEVCMQISAHSTEVRERLFHLFCRGLAV